MVREGIPSVTESYSYAGSPRRWRSCAHTGFHSPLGQNYEGNPYDV